MRKVNKTSRTAVKTQKKAATTLKGSSLSELRDLQRQAVKQAALPHAAQRDHVSSDNSCPSTAQSRRRPHRFFPPDSGRTAVTRDRAGNTTPGIQADPSGVTHAPPKPANTGPSVAKHVLSDDDVALFRRVVQSVTPRPETDRLLLQPVAPATPAQLQERRQHAMGQPASPALDVSDHYASAGLDRDDTVFLQTGQGPHLIKGLKKGKWPVQASLDLHGSTLDEARERMDRFIRSCRDHQIRCIRIVHGKGYGSKGGDPVLKDTVRRWLSQLAVVQAYVESDEANGGAGAVIALLSK